MEAKQPAKKRCRQYSVEYLKYGFVPAPHSQQQPLCLICDRVFTNEAMKPCKLLDHLKRRHPDKADESLAYFQILRDNFQKEKTGGNKYYNPSSHPTDGMRAAFNISLLIARSGKPQTIGEELILPAVREVLETVLHLTPDQIVNAIPPLSNSSVKRRVDEMADNIEETLCNMLRTTQFSLLLDESTIPGNESLLLVYCRFIKNESLAQEFLFARQLETDTKGESVFHAVENFFKEKNIPLSNILACAADGAPWMVDRHHGFTSFLKKAVPGVLTVHCVIHRQHLVAKHLSGRLHKSMGTVIAAINKIKAHALNSRIIRQLCADDNEEFERLLLNTEVRWLSKGNCMRRIYSLFDTVVEVIQDIDFMLSDELRNIKHDIAYLSDVFAKFDEINLQLKGNDVNLINMQSVISTFLSKLTLFKRNVARRELHQFPSLSDLEKEKAIPDDELQEYCAHLNQLQHDMADRYQEVLSLKIPDWMVNPFLDVNYEETGVEVEELITIKHEIELRPKFRISYKDFWLQDTMPVCYPVLWNKVQLLLVAFPTSCLVERGFSAVALLLSKQRNRLKITERGDLRLLLSQSEPDVEKLICLHRPLPSH